MRRTEAIESDVELVAGRLVRQTHALKVPARKATGKRRARRQAHVRLNVVDQNAHLQVGGREIHRHIARQRTRVGYGREKSDQKPAKPSKKLIFFFLFFVLMPTHIWRGDAEVS
ncbi:MAG: hypothetical protein IV100_14745 [Myxococcales bacterium]|nr:hypothetical protein [Myxococcales bacterium]